MGFEPKPAPAGDINQVSEVAAALNQRASNFSHSTTWHSAHVGGVVKAWCPLVKGTCDHRNLVYVTGWCGLGFKSHTWLYLLNKCGYSFNLRSPASLHASTIRSSVMLSEMSRSQLISTRSSSLSDDMVTRKYIYLINIFIYWRTQKDRSSSTEA